MKLKTPKTYEQQVLQLKAKNIVIDDEEAAKAFLQNVNYYRFSGYFLPYTKNGEKKCFKPVQFQQLKAVYEFDSQLRNLIASAVEDIEIYLKTQFSYYHAFKFGAEGYMDANNFNKKHNDVKFNKKIQSCINENRTTLVVKHHFANFEGKFPIWVIIEYFSMGMLSYFYKDMKNRNKAALAQDMYGVSYQVLESWLRCITDLRNKCAHYSRLYYWVFPALPKMPVGNGYKPTRRLFAQLYVLKMMYPKHDKWNENVLKPLIKLVKKYDKYISKNHLDFPYRWKSMLTWKE